MIDDTTLQHIAAGASSDVLPEQLAAELLAARQHITQLKQQLATEIKLPFTSASPVCDIEAGYAAGVNDSKEAIRRAGFLIEGDD
ncbi:hypothetical protein M8013_20910 [Enterobacteriaceae bacterium H4N4]|uniref:Uncharacterized protein n=1 Tax=Silvania confinis TaxID=2926470 RepID=A0A9J6QSE4_9ENTR|nr:hypothetical protein [Silvania confinis]MCU6671189.1 hypothetical protein [Silvania confinis]